MAKEQNKPRQATGVSTRARDFQVGEVYHIYQRGNHGKRTFLDASAKLRYLTRLFELAKEHRVLVHSFCLMANHIHFVLQPQVAEGISKMMQVLQQVHAREHNLRLKKTGNLWKQHFGCKRVESEQYYCTVMKYVEVNPVTSRRAPTAIAYRWSSAAAHAAGEQITIVAGDETVTTDLYLEGWRSRCGALAETWLKYLVGREIDSESMEKVLAMLDGKRRQSMAQRERANRRRILEAEAAKELASAEVNKSKEVRLRKGEARSAWTGRGVKRAKTATLKAKRTQQVTKRGKVDRLRAKPTREAPRRRLPTVRADQTSQPGRATVGSPEKAKGAS